MVLKVLQLCAVDFTVQNFLLPLIQRLSSRGLDVTTACSPGPYFPSLQQKGLRLTPLSISRSRKAWKHLHSTMSLYRYLRANHFDIVHVHTPIAGLIGRFAACCARVPIKIYTAHGFYFHDDMHPMKRFFHINLEKLGARCGDFIMTQSEEDRLSAIREKITSPDKIITIGNGVDIDRFDPEKISPEVKLSLRAEFHIPPQAPVVGMIGRLVKEKGYREFIGAAPLILSQFPQTHFLCIGDALESDHDASKREFFYRIRDLNLTERIHFPGMRADIPELLSILTVYTLPSYREGMPRSIIEAMAMGVPVVATNIRGCREEVLHGGTGYLVPSRDANALAASVIDLLANPGKAETFSRAAILRAREYFSEKLVLDRQWNVYMDLIRRKGLENRL
ncbi:glycosyltransferase family 4 protein [Candidatus Sumerlaeota bacterium]|nr:glycosyltransferase family 4 protein [Candidatus Sumerlaeota bacterium]